MAEFASIDELIAALESGQYEKGSGQFKTIASWDGEDAVATYCCLGVECEISGVPYDPAAGTFAPEGDGPLLPEGHWLLEECDWQGLGYDGDVVVDRSRLQIQQALANVNDMTDEWEPVIQVLRHFKEGDRLFFAENYVEYLA